MKYLLAFLGLALMGGSALAQYTPATARYRTPLELELPPLRLEPSLVRDICPESDCNGFSHTGGVNDHDTKFRALLDNVLIFRGKSLEHGHELWRSDGTEEGTYLIRDLNPGPEGSNPIHFTRLRNQIFFVVFEGPYWDDDGGSNYQLWKTDGTAEGTVLVKRLGSDPEGSGRLHLHANHQGNYIVIAGALDSDSPDSAGSEIWVSNGTARGTYLLKDILPGSYGSSPQNFHSHEGQVFFSAWAPGFGRELWKTDGTSEGTAMVADLVPGEESGLVYTYDLFKKMQSLGDDVYVSACSPELGCELFKTDGTSEGTVSVKDIYPGAENSSSPDRMVKFNGEILFTAVSDLGRELWKTDGTEAGTVLVKDVAEGLNQHGFVAHDYQLVVMGDHVYFTAQNEQWTEDSMGFELWKSDGTEEGTVVVTDLVPGSGSSSPRKLVAWGDQLYFQAVIDGVRGLYRTDGTEAGTEVVYEDLGETYSPMAVAFGSPQSTRGRLYFFLKESVVGRELYSIVPRR